MGKGPLNIAFQFLSKISMDGEKVSKVMHPSGKCRSHIKYAVKAFFLYHELVGSIIEFGLGQPVM